MKKYRFRYIIVFLMLLLTEILIGAFLHDGFIRAYGGDVLVLPLIYFLIRIFWAMPSRANQRILPAAMFLAGVSAELLQAADITGKLSIAKDSFLGIMLGTVFDPADLVCYAAGIALIYIFLFAEKKLAKEK